MWRRRGAGMQQTGQDCTVSPSDSRGRRTPGWGFRSWTGRKASGGRRAQSAANVGKPAFEPLLTSEERWVEAVRHRHHPQWGVMWHPERGDLDPLDVELLEMVFQHSTATSSSNLEQGGRGTDT